jgi:hypothetical protein
VREDLLRQANDATRGHAAALADLSADQASRSSTSKRGSSPRRFATRAAGSLRAGGATGGSLHLSGQPFFIGINDPVGLNPTGAPFDPRCSMPSRPGSRSVPRMTDDRGRRAIARASALQFPSSSR